MEGTTVEREYSALGNLFQQIITDMKNGTPIWEDFIAKASKLHAVLKSALTAVSAYLDAFQKIADAATNARGATKEIGTALTRMCLRHKAIETKMKAFASAIMDYLVNPLQEKLEDWKKTLVNLDKDHSREYKRARAELKKRSTDTLRLQKKARKGKGGDLQRRVETSMQDISERRQILEDAEKKAVRAALVEERSRFCLFVALLKPVVDSEVAMLTEVGHLQEGTGQLLRHTNEPHSLPAASEQVISDLQAMSGSAHWTPPSSPPSPRPLGLGSRKSSSLCSSISSLNSSSSGSHSGSSSVHHHLLGSNGTQPTNGALQPALTLANRSVSQPPRLGSVSSRDSGFTSQDTLHLPPLVEFRRKGSDNTSAASSCTTPVGNQDSPTIHAEDLHGENSEGQENKSCASQSILHDNSGSATWPELKDTMQFERAASAIMSDRPHTISTAYEKGHPRPALSVHTFTAHGSSESALTLATHASGSASQPVSPCCPPTNTLRGSSSANNQGTIYARPPLPTRCSSLERPTIPVKCGQSQTQLIEHKVGKPSSLPPHLTKDVPQATYVNMFELASMAASRAQGLQLSNQTGEHGHIQHEKACESSTSESSLESSSGYGSQGGCQVDDGGQFSQVSSEECRIGIVDIEVNAAYQDCSINSSNNDGLSISLCSLDEAIKSIDECNRTSLNFATINKTKPCVPKRRPLSMTATCPPTGLRLALAARRGSAGGNSGKPPPPVRRSSSISRPQGIPTHQEYISGNQINSQNPNQGEGDDSFPPPPAFLLNPSDHHPQADHHQSSRSTTPVSHGKGINVAETVKALTELKHTPASPSLLRRNAALQNQPSHTSSSGSQPMLSSFQQSKSAFAALQNSNVNPTYGTTGHKMFSYLDQNNDKYGSRNSINITSSYHKEHNVGSNTSDQHYDDFKQNHTNSTGYSATVSYTSNAGSSICNDSILSTFGQKSLSRQNSPTTSHNSFGKYLSSSTIGYSSNNDKNNPFSPINMSANSVYAQPSQIIAGFNNLGFGGNRNNENNMSPLAIRKMTSTPRSQSADRRGSDIGNSGGLIAAISARLAPQLSPRNSRRSVSGASENESNLHHVLPFKTSQDSIASHHSPSHKSSYQKGTPNVVSAVQPAFLDKLSATLKQRQSSGAQNRAFAVRQLINTKAQPDPRACHGSLMEQIKRGVTLRRNKHCNDRSAPKIR